MKKENQVLKERAGSFRRLVKRLFASWMKRHTCANDHEMLLGKLQNIEESIGIMAREIYRQRKQNK